MAADFHRPTRFPPGMFESYIGSEDPAELSRAAHDTAAAVLSRVREDPDPEIVDRLVRYTDEHGIDAIAELWSQSPAKTLPGALWRIYLLRTLIRQDAESVAYAFRRGSEVSTTIDQVVAGAATPTGPAEVRELADRILRGLFTGDFAVALDRASSFCRVASAGFTSLADDADAADAVHEHRPRELTRRALRLAELADELAACARLWRRESLD
ncbi:DNA-directed RNA polymerase subunit beta [Agromyces archimandritae]|uniref:DNA-directed RNA polymerase subunit beta n=1 Tax=Agromyces archimandritae TaxID=2781962 RepID=A0A975FL56_9MICO|nr:DNA-directed RNA polymerase subunit beta [Agromyces archimandritae]QTX03959.1 DNA-directed RNA polymerase subunit beta [Agromyces archimandritae]